MSFEKLIELRIRFVDMGNTLPLRQVIRPAKGGAVYPLLGLTVFMVLPLFSWFSGNAPKPETGEELFFLITFILLIDGFFLAYLIRILTDKIEFKITASEAKVTSRLYFRRWTGNEPLSNYAGLWVLILDVKRFRFGRSKELYQIYLVHRSQPEKDVLLFSRKGDKAWQERLQSYQRLLELPVLDQHPKGFDVNTPAWLLLGLPVLDRHPQDLSKPVVSAESIDAPQTPTPSLKNQQALHPETSEPRQALCSEKSEPQRAFHPPPSESKTQCANCGAKILQRTADTYGGLCVPCHHKAIITPPNDRSWTLEELREKLRDAETSGDTNLSGKIRSLISFKLDKERGWWKEKAEMVDDMDEALAVIAPSRDATEEERQSLGEHLRKWQEAHEYIRYIWGLEDLLQGQFPRTPPIYFSLPYSEPYDECYEPVALVLVMRGIDHEIALESLASWMKEFQSGRAWFLSLEDYFMWQR